MDDVPSSSPQRSWIDIAVRLAVLAGLLTWSFMLVRPFVGMVVWGGVLATTLYPLFARAERRLGGRTTLVAVVFGVVPVVVLGVPSALFVTELVRDVAGLRDAYASGQLVLPDPPPELRSLPLVGGRLYDGWASAQHDLTQALQHYASQLSVLGNVVFDVAKEAFLAGVKLLFSLAVMTGFLAKASRADQTVRALAVRVAGPAGDRLVSLARDTTRSVARGIVGVAFIQGSLGGLGCLLAGVPGAGLWTLLILVLAIAQLSPLFVLLPAAAYLFHVGPSWVAVIFTVWSVFVGLIDNVLKPMLLGKGVDAPMLVVFVGAIGGMLWSGVVGLFVGPVVLVVVFTLIRAWAFGSSDDEVPVPTSASAGS